LRSRKVYLKLTKLKNTMCRILFLKWTNKQKALDYIDAFYKAGYDDPHLQLWADALHLWIMKNWHNHGWGFLLVTKDYIDSYLSGEAFFNDEHWFEELKIKISNISWEFLLMAELRLTDEWYVSALNSHPFSFSTNNWYEWWFFYNWLLDYEKLAEFEWLDYSNFKKKNGTTIMWQSFRNELEKWASIKEALLCPIKALKSGYNLMCFLNDNNWNNKAYVNAYSKEELLENECYFEYSKLIKKDEPDLFFVGSNAIWVYKKDEYQDMQNWEFLEFDVDFLNEYYFNCYEDGRKMVL